MRDETRTASLSCVIVRRFVRDTDSFASWMRHVRCSPSLRGTFKAEYVTCVTSCHHEGHHSTPGGGNSSELRIVRRFVHH